MTSRSAPTSRGLSIRIGIPVRIAARPRASRGRGSGSAITVHCSESWGTVEETIELSMSAKPMPAQREQVRQRRAELVAGRLAHGGEAPVLGRPSSLPSANTPKWVWVLPTSTTSSMRRIIASGNGGPARRTACPGAERRRARRPRRRPVGQRQLRDRARAAARARTAASCTSGWGSVSRADAYSIAAEQQQVDVDHPRPVADRRRPPGRPRARPPCRRRAAPRARARSSTSQAGVEELRLVEHQADRLGLVDRGGARAPSPRARGSSATAASRCSRRSPTFEPRPR